MRCFTHLTYEAVISKCPGLRILRSVRPAWSFASFRSYAWLFPVLCSILLILLF